MVATCSCLLAGCGSNDVHTDTVKTETVTNYATLYVTNTVVLTNTIVVTNEIVKEVSADIPKDYVDGYNILQKMQNATAVNLDQALFQMSDVKVSYFLDTAIKKLPIEDEVKAKFELTLRKYGITINPESQNVILVAIDGIDDETPSLCYSMRFEVYQPSWVFRNGICHQQVVRVWAKNGKYGTVGKVNANETLLNEIEKGAEVFANDYLSANPKK